MGIWLELSCTILLISLLPYMTCMQWTSEDKKIFIIFQFTQAHQTCNTFTHTALDEVFALCSRYFQNVKLRLHFVDLTILPLANSISQKTSFLASLVVLNLDVRKFEQFFKSQNQDSNLSKIDFTQNQVHTKLLKFHTALWSFLNVTFLKFLEHSGLVGSGLARLEGKEVSGSGLARLKGSSKNFQSRSFSNFFEFLRIFFKFFPKIFFSKLQIKTAIFSNSNIFGETSFCPLL